MKARHLLFIVLSLMLGSSILLGQKEGDQDANKPAAEQGRNDRRQPERRRPSGIASRKPAHWGEETVGFSHLPESNEESRRGQMDTGPYFAGTIQFKPSFFGRAQYIFKGLAIRIGERQQAAVCYDTEMLQQRVAWSGDLFGFRPEYMGLIYPPNVAGDIAYSLRQSPGWSRAGSFADPRQSLVANGRELDVRLGPLPKDWAHYKGLYQHGNRVVLEYTVGKTRVRETPWLEAMPATGDKDENARLVYTRTIQVGASPLQQTVFVAEGSTRVQLVRVESSDGIARLERDDERITVVFPPSDGPRTVKLLLADDGACTAEELASFASVSPPPDDLDALTRPGPTLWNDEITTRGVRGTGDGPFVIDTLTLPFDNPYNSLMFIGGHAFFSNGDAAVTTVYGDVWLVWGIDDELQELRWKRFATGLFQPLGIQILDDTIYVTCRDQICVLHDRNHDGEADFIENFNNDGQVSWNAHEFVTNLERDSAGNFYVIKSDTGGITEHDGSLLRISADGSRLDRVATGFRNSNGLTVAPDDTIYVSPQEGDWTPGSCICIVEEGKFYGHLPTHHRDEAPTDYERPLCWIPRDADNSSGSHVWVDSDRWGPLQDHLLHLSAGQCRMLLVMQERDRGLRQGGTVPFDLDFESSVMRARFRPQDGQLYVSGMRSWVSRAAKDGCFQRVRYTGAPVHFPQQVRTYANGLAIQFYEPLDKQAAELSSAYKVSRWNYAWTDEYGSLNYSLANPGAVGKDAVDVLSATLLDERTLFLELADMRPVNQLAIELRIWGADGSPINKSIYYTIHNVPSERIDPGRLNRRLEAEGLTKDDASIAPGLVFRFSGTTADATGRDSRVGRLAALAVPRGGRPTPFLSGAPFGVTLSGFVDAQWPGEYRFRVETNGPTALSLNRELVLVTDGSGESNSATAAVMLRGGLNDFELDYRSNPQTDAQVRVLWQSESFPEEPIPPTALFHLRDERELAEAEQLRLGRTLFAHHQCSRCHAQPEADLPSRMPELHAAAPELRVMAGRLQPDWVARWVLDPHAFDPRARMPRLLDAHDPTDRQKAADLAAYLFDDAVEAHFVVTDPTPPQESTEAGEVLFEDLGCIACHCFTEPEAEDEFGRVSLYHVAAKFRPRGLTSFLLNPQAHHASSRMPNFRLDEASAGQLAALLRERSRDNRLPSDALPAADVKRGQRLFADLHCNQCHAAKDDASNELARPMLSSAFAGEPRSGCVADAPARGVPDFALTTDERSALRAFLAAAQPEALGATVALEAAQRLISDLRCGACHHRDEVDAVLPDVLAAEGFRGLAAEFAPSLTWAGEKLHARWMADFIAGRIGESPRPWLKGRMPAFPYYADFLAEGLAAEHGGTSEDKIVVNEQLADVGRELVSEAGLNCLQCHSREAHTQPLDRQNNIAPAIMFADVRDRLRHDYYVRFVLDPPRYEPRSKMPKASLDGKTTALADILGGDARQQFEAIWHYIHVEQ